VLQLAKLVHAKFQLSSFTQTDLDKFLNSLQVIFRKLLRKFQNFPILKKIQMKHLDFKRYLSPKFKPFSIFTKISKVILFFFNPKFALEISKFQNSEYEVHQSSPTDER
jgi:hypothetical protein